MNVPLSAYLAEIKKPLKRLVEILSKDFPYVSVLSTDSTGMRYSVRKRVIDARQSDWCERGSVIRVFDGRQYLEYSFNELDQGSLEDIEPLSGTIRERFRKSSAVGGRLPFGVPELPQISEQPLSETWQGSVEVLPEPVPAEQIIGRLSRLKDRAFQLSEHLVEAEARLEHMRVSKLFVSAKRELEQSYIWAQGYLIAVVRRDEATREMYASYSGLKGLELIEEMEAGIEDTMNISEQLLDAERIEPGEYEVILSPNVAGLLAHESFGHGVETDMFVKNRAKAEEYLGKAVASSIMNLRDGALAAEQTGTYRFDDEGVLGADTLVIEKGVFKTGISDLLSALRLGTPPTGNGKRESFERKAYARMTNTFFTGGTDSLEEMIASIDRGYLLEKFLSGMEDPKNWGIQGQILYAREIRDGKLTGKLVSPLLMFGYVPEVLGSVSMVSGEVQRFGSGMCGKGYKDFVKNSLGGPYIKTKMRLG
jgi:TldD protein